MDYKLLFLSNAMFQFLISSICRSECVSSMNQLNQSNHRIVRQTHDRNRCLMCTQHKLWLKTGHFWKDIKYMIVGVKSDALIMDRHRISWAGREWMQLLIAPWLGLSDIWFRGRRHQHKKIIQLEKLPLKKNFFNIPISEPQSWVRTPEEGACRNTVELA